MTGENKRDLLDGPSAYALSRVRSTYTACYLVLAAALFILSSTHVDIQWLNITLGVFLFIGVIPLLVLAQLTANKMWAEVEAGYTTFPQYRVDVEQRDPYLGRVIRKPGEPFLDSDRFKEIAARAKAEWTSAQGHPRTRV